MNDKLMKASLWARREFDVDSTPSPKTIRSWIKSGIIEGRFIDGKAYVFTQEKAGLAPSISKSVGELLRA
ncbi:hypothetical protein JQC92_00795 [Shewanella sp. 202IG2-18]|uniref:hypothetical protein n=1 Tax=Parashewanella hymeniacidonis TaxID=2807618 RepID=UPI00195F5582|nr:hypothetical protein [Parashewanella hymeniacidonis]MBM7070582.1 hypothetical protein [Parashewanella hymeniacidonis]